MLHFKPILEKVCSPVTKEVCQTVYDENQEQRCKTEWRTVLDEECSTVMDEQCSTDMEYICTPVEEEVRTTFATKPLYPVVLQITLDHNFLQSKIETRFLHIWPRMKFN